MDWPTVLGLISYIAIICCLTVWFIRNHYLKRRLWDENFKTEEKEKPEGPTPGSHKAGCD